MHSILHVPKLACNLVSISKLTHELNCSTDVSATCCLIQEQGSKRMIGVAKQDGGLYYFENDERMERQATIAKSNLSSVSNKDIIMWHRMLGHPNFHYLKHLLPDLYINKNSNFFTCDICQLAKHIGTSFPAKQYVESHPFSLVHSDISGPSRIKNIMGT